jgi:hypothetical protein
VGAFARADRFGRTHANFSLMIKVMAVRMLNLFATRDGPRVVVGEAPAARLTRCPKNDARVMGGEHARPEARSAEARIDNAVAP